LRTLSWARLFDPLQYVDLKEELCRVPGITPRSLQYFNSSVLQVVLKSGPGSRGKLPRSRRRDRNSPLSPWIFTSDAQESTEIYGLSGDWRQGPHVVQNASDLWPLRCTHPPKRFETKLLDRHLGRSDELALGWGNIADLSARQCLLPCWASCSSSVCPANGNLRSLKIFVT
jgi:hypothetical protein